MARLMILLATVMGCLATAQVASAQFFGRSSSYRVVPHTTTHNHLVPHGNHVDVVPHTTTHLDVVPYRSYRPVQNYNYNYGYRGIQSGSRTYGNYGHGSNFYGGTTLVPHTTTHTDLVPHGNHYDAVPHTTTHYHRVVPHTTTHTDLVPHGNHYDAVPHTQTHLHDLDAHLDVHGH